MTNGQRVVLYMFFGAIAVCLIPQRVSFTLQLIMVLWLHFSMVFSWQLIFEPLIWKREAKK